MHPLSHVIIRVTISILFVVAILFGNILTIIAIFSNKAQKTASNQFIAGLALADLLVAFCITYDLSTSYLFIDTTLYQYSDFVIQCLAPTVLLIFSFAASMINIVLIGLDRYFGVYYPIKHRNYHTIRNARKAVCCAYLIAAVAASLNIFWNTWSEEKPNYCDALATISIEFYLSLILPYYMLCVIFLIFFYIKVFKVAAARSNNSDKPTRVVTKILGCFCICWLPQMITMFLLLHSHYTQIDGYRYSHVSWIIYILAFMLACSNSFVNPIIYVLTCNDFKQAFKKILGMNTLGNVYVLNGRETVETAV